MSGPFCRPEGTITSAAAVALLLVARTDPPLTWAEVELAVAAYLLPFAIRSEVG